MIINTALHSGNSPLRHFEVLGTNGTAILQPIEPPDLTVELVKAAGRYTIGRQKVPLPYYQRYQDDFAELAASVRSERSLSVSPGEEFLIAETVLKVSDML